MYPSCDSVEYATTRLISFCTIAIKAMNSAVMAPITMTNESAASDNSNSGDIRATMKIPAVTIVAAWISAEIGVGPSIESGNQTCNGTWALLPIAPTNRHMHVTVISDHSAVPHRLIVAPAAAGAFANTV